MAARTMRKVTPKYKTKYRVRNWAVYEESLRRRGDITVPTSRLRPSKVVCAAEGSTAQ